MARGRPPIDPGKPHRFVQAGDGGLSAAASGALGRGNTDLAGVAVTSAYGRETRRCAVPGCGRPRDDDRHAVAG